LKSWVKPDRLLTTESLLVCSPRDIGFTPPQIIECQGRGGEAAMCDSFGTVPGILRKPPRLPRALRDLGPPARRALLSSVGTSASEVDWQ